jgi:hypothetical protein
MADTENFWSNRFHWCALAAGFLAGSEGRIDDPRYVQELAYHFFDTGAFKKQAKSAESPSSCLCQREAPLHDQADWLRLVALILGTDPAQLAGRVPNTAEK